MEPTKKGDCVAWKGLLCVGQVVQKSEPWITKSGVVYRRGFHSQRIVTTVDKKYIISCKIESTNLNSPIFICSVYHCDNEVDELYRAASMNPTTAMKKAFEFVDFRSKKKWNGNDFFGINRKDVSVVSIDNGSSEGVSEESPVFFPNVATHGSRNISWVGLQDIGENMFSENYVVTICGKEVRLQPGFLSLRKIGEIDVKCCIEKGDNKPIFKLIWNNDGGERSCSSENCNLCLKQMLSELHIKSYKKSGFDFFGLTRPEILNVLINNKSISITCKKSKKVCEANELFGNILKVRNRNAGPTSSLKSSAAQTKRNSLIHEVVDFTSFGDIKGLICAP